jgi:hypothetical protein
MDGVVGGEACGCELVRLQAIGNWLTTQLIIPFLWSRASLCSVLKFTKRAWAQWDPKHLVIGLTYEACFMAPGFRRANCLAIRVILPFFFLP